MHDPWDKGFQSCTNGGGGAIGRKRVKLGQSSKIFYSESTRPTYFKTVQIFIYTHQDMHYKSCTNLNGKGIDVCTNCWAGNIFDISLS